MGYAGFRGGRSLHAVRAQAEPWARGNTFVQASARAESWARGGKWATPVLGEAGASAQCVPRQSRGHEEIRLCKRVRGQSRGHEGGGMGYAGFKGGGSLHAVRAQAEPWARGGYPCSACPGRAVGTRRLSVQCVPRQSRGHEEVIRAVRAQAEPWARGNTSVQASARAEPWARGGQGREMKWTRLDEIGRDR